MEFTGLSGYCHFVKCLHKIITMCTGLVETWFSDYICGNTLIIFGPLDLLGSNRDDSVLQFVIHRYLNAFLSFE